MSFGLYEVLVASIVLTVIILLAATVLKVLQKFLKIWIFVLIVLLICFALLKSGLLEPLLT